MLPGQVWQLTCDPTYFVRIEWARGRMLGLVVCGKSGRQRRGYPVRHIRATTFQKQYRLHGFRTLKRNHVNTK